MDAGARSSYSSSSSSSPSSSAAGSIPPSSSLCSPLTTRRAWRDDLSFGARVGSGSWRARAPECPQRPADLAWKQIPADGDRWLACSNGACLRCCSRLLAKMRAFRERDGSIASKASSSSSDGRDRPRAMQAWLRRHPAGTGRGRTRPATGRSRAARAPLSARALPRGVTRPRGASLVRCWSDRLCACRDLSRAPPQLVRHLHVLSETVCDAGAPRGRRVPRRGPR